MSAGNGGGCVSALCGCGVLLTGRDTRELMAAARRCYAEHPEESADSPRGRELRRCLTYVLLRINLVSQADSGSYGFAPTDHAAPVHIDDSDAATTAAGMLRVHPHRDSRQFAQARSAWQDPAALSRTAVVLSGGDCPPGG